LSIRDTTGRLRDSFLPSWKDHRSATLAALVLLFAAFLFGARIDLPLLEPEEARYAEIPRQMLAAGRYLVPVHDGQDYLDKPPLLYWMVMGSYRLFGVQQWSARLPTVLTAWLTVAVVLVWGWRTVVPAAGVAGAAILALTGDFVYRAPMLTMNGPLALFVAVSLACGHIALRGHSFDWSWWLASGLACGLGVLMKGPVAAVMIAVPLLAWLWFDRTVMRPRWGAWLAWAGIAFAVAAPWFALVAVRQPEFVGYFFWKHHIERFAAPFDHAGPVWAYLPQLAVGFLPWTLVAAALAWKQWKGDGTVPPVACLPLIAGVCGLVFFSLAGSKRPVYLVPIEPPLALAAGALFWSARSRLNRLTWVGLGTSTALALGAGVLLWLPTYSRSFSIAPMAHLAKERCLPVELPIFCYGHGWDSVGFYLERDDVKTFLGDRRNDFGSELAARGGGLVFVSTKRDGQNFLEILPKEFSFHPLGSDRHVQVGIAARRCR
jgi:4-amino-4-deoxy-L-arabinose transferase-like glycosyltransferase